IGVSYTQNSSTVIVCCASGIFTASSTGLTIGSGAGQLEVSATGGSAANNGSATGNGGSLSLSVADNLNVSNPAFLALAPLGANGNGASINLKAGTAGPSNLAIAGALSANAAGAATGGNILLSSSSGLSVNGNLTASGAQGGGTITLTSTSP